MPSGLPTAPDTTIGLQPPSFQPPQAPKAPGGTPVILNPIIAVLKGYLDVVCPGGLSQAVKTAYQKIPDFMNKLNIRDAESFIDFANDLLKWIPHENFQGKDIYDILCMFYFILDQPPLKELQTPIEPKEVGQPLSWLSSWVVVYAQLIGLFMDTPASLTRKSLESFIESPLYGFEDCVIPEAGFRTFNEFFSRSLKLDKRPIEEPDNDAIIVYPADCTYDNSIDKHSIIDIKSGGTVSIKGLTWTISSLLQGSDYANEFDGGIFMHAYLHTYNYHRQHAPVSGTVLEAKNIQGAAYLEVDAKCRPVRKMCEDPEMPNSAGYQFLQMRGVVVIDNPTLGKVAVLPIGMAMISSVKLSVREGDVLDKGDEISHFLFGGSDIICVFQAKAGLQPRNFVKTEKEYSKMGSILARAPILS
ncbi:Phosphatidylserine decarboxylase proenzyme 3 [Tolypocladium ophioglossoides CBS 100239]|uniref:Phosphatidylserine decarboxylase proenzyme 3 n=1 Tax=Tolypocladium ophioglossoides (strain CBS 100239) TaxID=1163406 RepID=A0A0L0N1V4_TOLOC|nr:Phosphatidylserine decarboxylase proenzyme 3 [Tolypocladium ophioglossoides CBS 100239]